MNNYFLINFYQFINLGGAAFAAVQARRNAIIFSKQEEKDDITESIISWIDRERGQLLESDDHDNCDDQETLENP